MTTNRLTQQVLQASTWAAIAAAVASIGVVIGAASVILPFWIPVGIVGLFLLLLLWVVPDLRVIPDRSARLLVYPFVFSALSIPAYYTIILPGLPWISARRLGLILLAVPTIITLAGSLKFRERLNSVVRCNIRIFAFLVIFLAAFCIATITSTNPSSSLSTMSVFATNWALPFIAITMLFRAPRDTYALMVLLCICNFVDFGLGAVEFYKQRPFLIYALPASIQAQILASADTYNNLFIGQGFRNGLFRAASTFNVSLSWGEMAAMLAPISAYFATHGTKIWSRGFGVAGIIASIGAIFCSGARGAYVAFFGSMAVYAIVWALRSVRTNPKSLGPLVTTAIIGVGLFSVAFLVVVAGFGRRYILGGGAQQGSSDARWEQWRLAKPKILIRPWGHGPGTAPGVVNYAPFGGITLDSYFISALVDFGIIGFAAWFLIIGTTIFACIRTYIVSDSKDAIALNSLACSLTAFFIYRLTLSQQENMTTMCAVLAMSLVTLATVRRQDASAH